MFVLLLSTFASAGVEDPTHLLAPLKTRRRSGSIRVKPAPSTELPYDSTIENGRGWNHHTEQFVARPFEPYTAALRKLDTSLEVEYHKKVITSTSEYSEAMRTTAYVQAGGWGLSLKASFGLERATRMQSKDVLFILHASKELGFEGWRFSDVPSFTPVAKAKLCDHGTYTPEIFEELYGTYYVRGIRKATAMDVIVKLETKTSSESEKVSASLEAKWSGFGFSVGGGFSFAKQVYEEQSESRVSVFAKAYGTSRTFIPIPDMNNLDKIIEDYERVSSDGAGIALTLERYDDHPDYIKIQHECGRTFASVERDEFWMDKYVDVAVEAQLLAEEVLSKRFTKCGAYLAKRAFNLYDELVTTPEDQLSPDGYTTALLKLNDMKKLWDSDLEICRMSVVVKHSDHPSGEPGKFFFFDRDEWKAMTGAALVEGKYKVTQMGSRWWTGEVIVWDNGSGVHGRRTEGASGGQWKAGDVIKLADATWKRFKSAQCSVDSIEYAGDHPDNPIFNGGGFIGTMTRTQCMAECMTRHDQYGRKCVAIEMSTHSDDPNTKAACALAWGCEFNKEWSKTDVFLAEPSVPKTCGGNAGGRACKFPFTYQGVEYNSCTTADHHEKWCYTTDPSLWGNCDCE